jgi:hypothetical protein
MAVFAGGAATGFACGVAMASTALVAAMPSTADNASTAAGLIFIVVVLEYYDSPRGVALQKGRFHKDLW